MQPKVVDKCFPSLVDSFQSGPINAVRTEIRKGNRDFNKTESLRIMCVSWILICAFSSARAIRLLDCSKITRVNWFKANIVGFRKFLNL